MKGQAADLSQVNTTISSRVRGFRIESQTIRTMVSKITDRLGVGGYHLGVTFVGPRRIRLLNREFRGIDRSTDVLSFPQIEWQEHLPIRRSSSSIAVNASLNVPAEVLGDIVISLQDAQTNAKNIGRPFDREVGFLLVHGILHLCGYDHEQPNDEKNMRQAQRRLMRVLGEGTSSPLWLNCVKARRTAKGRARK